jgi:uncharacterized repeat protein (TIGR01451 family)
MLRFLRSWRRGTSAFGRGRALATLTSAAVVAGTALVAVPSALASVSATSPAGEVSISTPGPVLSGVEETYTLTITNTTSTTANTALIGVQLPSGMSLNHLAASCQRTNTANLPGAALTCGFTNLAPGASATATFGATAASPGSYVAQVQGDLDIGSPTTTVVADSVSLSIPVSPGPTDIQVTGSSNQGSPPVGSQFNYTFQVKNNGPQAAYSVTFDDALPAGISLVGFSSDIASCTGGATANSVHCDMSLLGVGQQATITITASPTATGTFTDFASVAMANPDRQASNNTVGVTVQPK